MKYIHPGFHPDTIKQKDFILGSVASDKRLIRETLMPSMDWTPYLPKIEQQSNNNFDSFSCTNFSNCNAAEIIHKLRYGVEVNYSDRFSAVISGTVPGHGNSHNVVAEATRKKGFVLEEVFPFTENMLMGEFFTAPGQEIFDIGLKWVSTFEYGYERVRPQDMALGIKLSPLVAAVDSRTPNTAEFDQLDHSIVISAYIKERNKWKIFDSYFGREMEYDFDYPFGFIMRYHYKLVGKVLVVDPVKLAGLPPQVKNFINRLLAFFGA